MKLNHIYITRFIAALAVVVHHFGQDIYPFNKGLLYKTVHFGDEFVNYFFILSGFIMVVAYYKPNNATLFINKKKYLVNRFARIYPVYLLSLLILLLNVVTINTELYNHFGIRFLIELLLLQSWTGKPSLNFPGWTLSVEMFFYICFPFLLKFLSKRTNMFLLLTSIFIFLLNFAANIYFSNHYSLDSSIGLIQHFFPLFHIVTFIEGIIAGLIFMKNYTFMKEKQLKVKIVAYSLALTYLIISIYGFNFQKYHHNGLLVPAYFSFIVAFSLESRWTATLSNTLFIYLGDISYSLYILQVPVWLFFTFFTKNISLDKNLSFYLYLLTLIATSSLIYSFFERKAQTWIKIRSKPLLA